MINKIITLIFVGLLAACSQPTVVHAKSSAPVEIEYAVDDNVNIGEQVTTTIRFVAKTDMQNMVISAASYNGVSLLSGGEQTVFTSLKSGDAHEIKVRVQLNESVGYLAVFAATTDAQSRTQHKNIAIRYGAQTVQKSNSQTVSEGATGELLILMPAEAN